MKFESLRFYITLLSSIPIAAYPSLVCDTASAVTRDVVVIGGGSSGTYAAIQLLDLGKSVALIEQKPILGGHTNTYTDPSTNQTVDYGVHQWNDMATVTEFFDRLGVPYTKDYVPSPGDILYFDFKQGKQSTRSALNGTVDKYANVVEKYDFLQYSTELPDPVPEDIYRPFGDVVKKYGLEGYVNNLWNGQGDILKMPALYIFKDVGPAVLKSMQTNFIYTKNHNNHEVFENARNLLGNENVLLSTKIAQLKRDASGVSMCLNAETGRKLVVHSKKILITIPPLLDNNNNNNNNNNLMGFDMAEDEMAVFGQFKAVGYYVSLVRIPGLPTTAFMYRNIASDTLFGQPTLPALYRITLTDIPELYIVEYGSLQPLSEQVVREGMLQSIRNLRQSVGSRLDQGVDILAFDSHTPYHLHVTPDAIRDGFYRRLYALQGRRNTFYSGAAFHAHDSALLWRFTKRIVGDLVAELGG